MTGHPFRSRRESNLRNTESAPLKGGADRRFSAGRVRASGFLLALAFAVWGVAVSAAEPPAECRDLSRRFANNREQLAIPSLAKLGTCITTEIGAQAATPASSATRQMEGTPSAASQADASTPSATRKAASAPLVRPWGIWPSSPPWPGLWPPPSPWES